MSSPRQVSNRAVEAVDHLDAWIRKLPARWLLAYVALAAIFALAAACMPSMHKARTISELVGPESIHAMPHDGNLVAE